MMFENPLIVGSTFLVIVVIASMIEKRWRKRRSANTVLSEPLEGEEEMYSEEHNGGGNGNSRMDGRDVEPEGGDYYPQPPSDLMPAPMEPVF